VFVPGTASRYISGIDCISRLRSALPSWSGFLSREQIGEINALLKIIYRCGFSCELIQQQTLTATADKRLFAKICGQVHCLHSLLSPATNYSVRHRLKGHHPFELPRHNHDLSCKRFLLRCLYDFK